MEFTVTQGVGCLVIAELVVTVVGQEFLDTLVFQGTVEFLGTREVVYRGTPELADIAELLAQHQQAATVATVELVAIQEVVCRAIPG